VISFAYVFRDMGRSAASSHPLSKIGGGFGSAIYAIFFALARCSRSRIDTLIRRRTSWPSFHFSTRPLRSRAASRNEN
jgi:hypothetical protein